mmetsp:Transcript_38172/g.107276  ORF Transcript_38172/g.107276 Transcript_38172/m.107276 type:complete len:257 (-) Transcript_38172:14-784(-)
MGRRRRARAEEETETIQAPSGNARKPDAAMPPPGRRVQAWPRPSRGPRALLVLVENVAEPGVPLQEDVLGYLVAPSKIQGLQGGAVPHHFVDALGGDVRVSGQVELSQLGAGVRQRRGRGVREAPAVAEVHRPGTRALPKQADGANIVHLLAAQVHRLGLAEHLFQPVPPREGHRTPAQRRSHWQKPARAARGCRHRAGLERHAAGRGGEGRRRRRKISTKTCMSARVYLVETRSGSSVSGSANHLCASAWLAVGL